MTLPFVYETGWATVELSARFVIWSGKSAIELIQYIKTKSANNNNNDTEEETSKRDEAWIDLKTGKECNVEKTEKL